LTDYQFTLPESYTWKLLDGYLPTLLNSSKADEVFPLKAERIIANFIMGYAGESLEDIQQVVASMFCSEKLAVGLALLVRNPLHLMTAEQIHDKKYFKLDGQWDWEFKNNEPSEFVPSKLLARYSSHSNRVSQEEERIINIILSERDEPLDVQGYAGSGKTWIISRLIEVLDKEKTAFLAETWNQISALKLRIPGASGYTFAGIAKLLFESGLLKTVRSIKGRYGSQYLVSNLQLAKNLQCYEIGNHDRETVAKYAQDIVRYFCYTTDAEITLEHVRKVFRSQTPLHHEMLLHVAMNLWELICIPRERIFLPIRNYHLVKAFSLTRMGIPNSYTHIIVDETHNLSAPIIQILQQSPQPVFTFGDYYQALEGLKIPYNISATLRKRVLSHSVRAGSNIEELYNKILSKHPIKPEVEFLGNRTKATKLISYKKFEVPDRYCAILAKSLWSMFWVAQKLHSQAAQYHIIKSAMDDLDRLVDNAISFYKTGNKPRHYNFADASSWENFIQKNKEQEPALPWVDRLIRGGFERQHLDAIFQASMPRPQNDAYPKNVYIIGRVWDCRNSEFDRVLLLDDVVGRTDFTNNHSKVISHIYTGISRAKHELYIPESISGWLDNF
jgi:hypothetical protein